MERLHPEMTTDVRKNPKIAVSAVAAITTKQRAPSELADAHAHVALRRCKAAGSVNYAAVRLPSALVMASTLRWPLLCHAQGVAPTPQPQGTPAQPEEITTETYGYHFQSTGTEQFQPAFPSRFQGPQSLSSAANGREIVDATAYLGIRPWDGAEIWFNPEIDQGFGLGNTFGVAGYTSGEAYKAGPAVALGLATGTVPSTAAVRSYHTKGGIVPYSEQQISPNLGMFARFSLSQGNVEEDAFTDINQSIQVGLSASGDRWQRPHDTVGAAFVVNEISHAGKLYLEAGGLGGIIGDGALPAAGPEQIFETFYSVALSGHRSRFVRLSIGQPSGLRRRPWSGFGSRRSAACGVLIHGITIHPSMLPKRV
jgi:hypothetical protein